MSIHGGKDRQGLYNIGFQERGNTGISCHFCCSARARRQVVGTSGQLRLSELYGGLRPPGRKNRSCRECVGLPFSPRCLFFFRYMFLKVFAGLVVVGHCLLWLVDHGFFFGCLGEDWGKRDKQIRKGRCRSCKQCDQDTLYCKCLFSMPPDALYVSISSGSP